MKIICSDYDGTLNHGGITPEKLLAIRRWQEAGNLFAVVSGRNKDFFFELKERNIPVDYLLSCNGAVISDRNFGTLLDIKSGEGTGAELTEFLFSLGCPFIYFNGEKSLRIRNKAFPLETGEEYSPEKVTPPFNQISTALDTFENASLVTQKTGEKYGNILNPLQNGICIDIVPSGVDKAQGIYELLKITGGKKEDIIAVGDNINDEAMIKEFYSYAMANGVDSIKAIADNITHSIEELIEREI